MSAGSAIASQLAYVALDDISQLTRLQSAGFDVTYLSGGNLAEVILMNRDDQESLNSTGLNYFIGIQDLEAFNRSRLRPGRDDMGGYHTFSEIVARLEQLHDDYPEIVSAPIEIGTTVEDRPLLAIRVSDNPDEDEDEPEALFTSLIHCREVVTSYILFGVIDQMVADYGNDDRITRLVDERQTWFIPVVNPDGYVFNEELSPDGGGMWRKNRRENANGTMGVDLNRNFGAHWGYDNVGSSANGNNETYRGAEAFSELETQAIRDFVIDHHISTSIFFHSYSNLCIYPYGYDVLQPPDRSVFSALSRKLTDVNNYLPGCSWEVIYRTNGDSDDWLYSDDQHDPIFAFTLEVGSRQDSFWPDLDRVEPLVAENIEAVLTLIDYADSPHRVLAPPSPVPTSANISENGTLSLRWQPGEDDYNQAVAYRVRAQLPGDPVVDEGLPDQTAWKRVNFSMSQVQHHSGSHSYRAALQTPMATLTHVEPLIAPDTIRAWLNYTMRSNRSHCLALEASLDGNVWEPLAGDRTQEMVVNQQSIGAGIWGISGGWGEAYWLTEAFAGQRVMLRFRYYSFNLFPNPANSEFCYIDDISPMPSFDRDEVIAEDVEVTRWQGEIADYDPAMLFSVQAVDTDGDVSFYSLPTTAESLPDFVLRCTAGWNLSSASIITPDRSLESIFAPWLERENLLLVKNGWGQFYLPQADFNQIEAWDPLAGYYIKSVRSDTLVYPGYRVDYDTPIDLVQGWNLVGYLPMETIDAEQAFAGIRDNLILVKNGSGEFWLVAQDFNNLSPLEPGDALALKLREDGQLIYPGAGDVVAYASRDAGPASLAFIPETPFNMSLILDLPAGHEAGEIRLYDSDGNHCGGTQVLAEDRVVGVAAWAEEHSGGIGFEEGEPIRICWMASNRAVSRIAFDETLGDADYATNGFARLTLDFGAELLPFELSLQAHPNPFNGNVKLIIGNVNRSEVSLSIVDAAGRLIDQLNPGVLEVGNHEISWDGSKYPTGLYFARVTAYSGKKTDSARLKLLLIK